MTESGKAQQPHMQFEYDLSYRGGSYAGTAYKIAYIPARVIDQMGLEEGFRQWTGVDPIHITFYDSDTLYTEDGNWLD